MQAANLFDLRRIIGGLFVVYGVLLTILGLTDSEAEIDKAAGVQHQPVGRASACSSSARLFLLWALTRPLGGSCARPRGRARGAGSDAGSTRRREPSSARGATARAPAGGGDARGQQRQHRAAEAAADHPGAGGAGGLSAATVRSTSGTDAS